MSDVRERIFNQFDREDHAYIMHALWAQQNDFYENMQITGKGENGLPNLATQWEHCKALWLVARDAYAEKYGNAPT